MSEYWSNRHAEVCHGTEEEYARLIEDWRAAYRAEFRRFAIERNWKIEDIESGWLDELPDEAMLYYGCDTSPEKCARKDVTELDGEVF